MNDINIEKSFITENRSVYTFLSQPGQGLYIPLYQREYSWDSDNILQLIEDINKGIERISEMDSNKEIRFLGTLITLVESNKNNIYPQDAQAVPSRIEKLIDGQQRLSTITILGALLTKHLQIIKNKTKRESLIYKDIEEICNSWSKKLVCIFSLDLNRGTPTLKPKIIRGNKDYWTRDKSIDEAYKSGLSNFLAHSINAYLENKAYPSPSSQIHGKVLSQNIKILDEWLFKNVAQAHIQNTDNFTPAIKIIEKFNQEFLWDYERPELVELICQGNYTNKNTESFILSELVQILSVCHYLLDRCIFTIIQPTDEDWAFDMFQSLNGTGTPLTALETFKPRVTNDTDSNEDLYKGSENEKSFDKIHTLFTETTSAQQKNKLTNDYLTSFFVAFNGSSISSHFSNQRKALMESYESFKLYEERQEFIHYLGIYADFYKKYWININDYKDRPLDFIIGEEDGMLATLLIQFLKSTSHKMAITILGTFYRNIILNKENAKTDFISAVKLVAAFYILWRSGFSNSGLDNIYRDFFKTINKSWRFKNGININELKEYFISALKNKKIENKESWKEYAISRLNYQDAGVSLCRLVLFIVYHDTKADELSPGLMKQSRKGTCDFLNLSQWNSPSLKTVEHIAPQNNNNNLIWNEEIYKKNLSHSIGNLTLLPIDLNSSIGNKSWKEKFFYYKTVGEKDPQKISTIKDLAKNEGIELSDNTIDLLQKSEYGCHMESIMTLDAQFEWDSEIINKRTNKILDILWERLWGEFMNIQ